jgi:hypothetical protein
MPREKLDIQYAAASRFGRGYSGILDHPRSRMMTAMNAEAADPYKEDG